MLHMSEMNDVSIRTRRGWWIQLMFLSLTVSGVCSLVTVDQPPVLTSALGRAVMLQCQLLLSPGEKMKSSPILYWERMNAASTRLWPDSDEYRSRVALLDSNPNSSNKSMMLKDVQWADSGKYRCKLSIHTETRSRKLGNGSLLVVYDTMSFNLTHQNDSLLRCEVKASCDPALVLSIFRDGVKLQSVNRDPRCAAAAQLPVTLSESVCGKGGGKYECQLHLNQNLITKSSFYYNPPVTEDKNVSITASPTVSVPEPWFLYGSLLLVPIIFLLVLITAYLCRC
ncbi:uncharacterized protein LOC122881741 isoform X1 [Xyrichtys novacula]|uniref:Uncharacterized protein LOC122881741 isoform X1 n=1 Tax=Xyrichtys novacula TaxID=13765 RepID=A0AAV1FP49_XYRNO|nr:uncharacterized protein LOC122881741 isoform X1 [Xyrichtys novacula]